MEYNFTEISKKVRSDIDKLDGNRESILSNKREIIRRCSDIIKKIHRNELDSIEEKINTTGKMIREQEETARKVATRIGKNYINDIKQEYTEAVVFYKIVVDKPIPDHNDLRVNAYEYIMGLADVMGELKRLVLNKIRNNDFENAERFYNIMEDLQQFLFSLDYPSGLLPGFRHKVDIARNIIRKTVEIMTTAKSNYELNQNLKKALETEK